MSTHYRLAIVSTHPIQYHSPWFRELAAQPDLSIHVFYCHQATPEEQARAGFGVAFDWDIPLLEGYPHTFLKNVAKPAGHGRFSGFDTPEIGKIIGRREYDAVLVNGWHYKSAWQAIWACWKSGTKVLVRGDSHLHTYRGPLKRMAKWLGYRTFIPRFDACLAVGHWSREYFLHYGAHPERIFLVPHTVDNHRIAAERSRWEAVRNHVRSQWGLDARTVVFAFAGKFIEKKRPLTFVRALDRAAREGAAVQGLMVGDGSLRADCEEFVAEHRSPIRFTGFLNQSQIISAYVASDLLVLPSDGDETWGLVVNEAMACGRPCIISDHVGCGPDLVRAGVTGAIFPLDDVEGLAALMIALSGDRSHLAFMSTQAACMIEMHSTTAAINGVLQCLAAIS